MLISDWSSDMCSSDLCETYLGGSALQPFHQIVRSILLHDHHVDPAAGGATLADALERLVPGHGATLTRWFGAAGPDAPPVPFADLAAAIVALVDRDEGPIALCIRSEEHTSELQSLMRTSYAVFCLKKKNNKYHQYKHR